LTASASWFTPRSSARRAVSSKLICFGIVLGTPYGVRGTTSGKQHRPDSPSGRRTAGAVHSSGVSVS
jgi:hypothetical protein